MAKPNWEDTRLTLIDTYKWMNNELRPRGEDALAADHGGESIKSIVRQMKDNELMFAKALTQSLTGEVLGELDQHLAAVLQAALRQGYDDGAAGLFRRLEDGLRDLHVVGVERAYAVASGAGGCEDVESGYECHTEV